MRAIQCLIISIFAILSASGTAPWGGYLGKYLLQRPFIGGLIGDITQGILIGAAMQLVYIRLLQCRRCSVDRYGHHFFPLRGNCHDVRH